MSAATSPLPILAVSTAGYIALAWIVTFVVVGAYAAWVLRRGRELSRRVPEDERRWM
jgi:heme exporter protein CcmD